jgi:hypothetical protein
MYLYTVIFGMSLLFYSFDGFNITRNVVTEKYRKFRSLNKLVETQYKTIGVILWVSVCMIAKMYWINFIQYLNRSVVQQGPQRSQYHISYVIQGKLYTMVVKLKKGPQNILLISDEKKEDVTDLILPFLGPEQNWHSKTFSPSFWNREFLEFDTADGETKSFKGDETIQL